MSSQYSKCSKNDIRFNNGLSSVNNNNFSVNNDNYMDTLDLNIMNYTLQDIYKLFNIQNSNITKDIIKNARKKVLKFHPDKSNIDKKYYDFFNKAYDKLLFIYEFKNKNENKKQDTNDYRNESNKVIIDKLMETKGMTPAKFNNLFEKNYIISEQENIGYGDWLKTDEGLINSEQNNISDSITKNGFNNTFEKHKENNTNISVYQGVDYDPFSNMSGGTLLDPQKLNSYSYGELFSGGSLVYTDVKQASINSIIPIQQELFNKQPQYKNVEEYIAARSRMDIEAVPLDSMQCYKILQEREQNEEEKSASIAFYYAKQVEQSENINTSIWSSLKRIDV